ncbi:MAG: Uma2 family endonuclease [Actinomycetota bacterium]
MALSADPAARRYTYADLETFPDDHFRREIIDGELIVNPSPVPRHQKAVTNFLFHLESYARRAGGHAFSAPLDVFFAEDNVVEPDLLFVRADHSERIGSRYVMDAPDLVVEISSPSTRHLELVRKRELYQRFGVPEYWYVDLEAERVEMYRLEQSAYTAPVIGYSGQALESARLTGFAMPVDEALGLKP